MSWAIQNSLKDSLRNPVGPFGIIGGIFIGNDLGPFQDFPKDLPWNPAGAFRPLKAFSRKCLGPIRNCRKISRQIPPPVPNGPLASWKIVPTGSDGLRALLGNSCGKIRMGPTACTRGLHAMLRQKLSDLSCRLPKIVVDTIRALGSVPNNPVIGKTLNTDVRSFISFLVCCT